MVLDPVLPQPFYSVLPMLLGSGCEEANVVPLLEPLIDLRDRIRVRLRVSHLVRILVVDVLADAPVYVNDEDFSQVLAT